MRMRMQLTAVSAIALALLLVFAGCNLGLAEEAPSAVDAEHDYEKVMREDAQVRAARDGESFRVTSVTTTIDAAEEQQLKIVFADGILDEGSLGAIRLYQLSDAVEDYQAYIRGEELSLSGAIFALENGGSEVYLDVDASEVQTDLLELYIPGSVTANGELKQLDQDEDGVGGETEDDYIAYITVSGAPDTLNTGVQRNPRGSFDVNLYFVYDPADPGNNEQYTTAAYYEADPPTELLLVYDTPANATADDFDGTVSLSGHFLMQRKSGDQWVKVNTSVSPHDTYPSVDVLTIEQAFEEGVEYRWVVAFPWSSESWNGYPLFFWGLSDQHRTRFYDQHLFGDEFTHYTDGVSGVAPQIGSTKAGASAYVDIEFTDLDDGNNEEIIRSSVSKDLFRVYSEFAQVDLPIQVLVWQNATTVRLVLEASDDTVPSHIRVYIDSGIRTELDDTENPGERITTNAFNAPLRRTGILGLSVGDTGPAGGLIFYVDQDNDYSWQYLEAAPDSTEWYGKTWGGYATLVGNTSEDIGSGAANTAAIVAAYGDFEPYNNSNDYVARLADQLEHTHNGTTYDDWYLPSAGELGLMYENLRVAGNGGFTTGYYWTSSEHDQNRVIRIHFSDGSQDSWGRKDSTWSYARAVRSVY